MAGGEDHKYEYVRFVVVGTDGRARLAQLGAAIAAIEAEKATDEYHQVDLDDEMLKRLRPAFPNAVVDSLGAPGDYDLESVLATMLMCEYDLLGVSEPSKGTADVQFFARAYPYGGVGSLIRLVQAFGFEVVGCNDGSGYADFDMKDWPWALRGEL